MQAKQQEVDEARCAAAPRPVRSERIRSRRSAAAPRPSSVLAALQPDEESEEDESGGEAEDGGGSSDEESACWLLYSAVRAYRNTAGHPISDPFVKLPNKKYVWTAICGGFVVEFCHEVLVSFFVVFVTLIVA